MNAQNLAAQDHDNVYNLWDAEVGFSCLCEPGYSGPTCASKMCKYGIDPLYYDDDVMAVRAPTARVSFSVGNLTGSEREISPSPKTFLEGTYAIKFYDAFGEDYQTGPLAATAGCGEITAALESMANDVVPSGSVVCSEIKAGAGVDVNSRDLQYLVREHLVGENDDVAFVRDKSHGFVDEEHHLKVRWNSQHGRVYIDGHHTAFDLELGDQVLVSSHAAPLRIFSNVV